VNLAIGALNMGRRQAEALFLDTFTVYRQNGTATDPVTLEERPTYATIHSDVAGKFQVTDQQPRQGSIPGAVTAESSLQWHTSVSTLGVRTDDEVECTGVGEGGDPDLVGVRVRVVGPFVKSHATARRFPVEEIS
jgi:hypothetical protein